MCELSSEGYRLASGSTHCCLMRVHLLRLDSIIKYGGIKRWSATTASSWARIPFSLFPLCRRDRTEFFILCSQRLSFLFVTRYLVTTPDPVEFRKPSVAIITQFPSWRAKQKPCKFALIVCSGFGIILSAFFRKTRAFKCNDAIQHLSHCAYFGVRSKNYYSV